ERLRDPSHWASLPLDRLRALGAAAGLALEAEEIVPLALDLAEWLERGSGHAVARPLMERLLAAPPTSAERLALADPDTVLAGAGAAGLLRAGDHPLDEARERRLLLLGVGVHGADPVVVAVGDVA